MNWIKDKISRGWQWIKAKAKWLFLGVATVGTAGMLLSMGAPKIPDVALEKMQEKYNASPTIQAKYEMRGASLAHNKIKNPELDLYKGEPKDEIEITIGEESEGNFVPNIKMKRWNEVWFKVKPRITAELKDQELEFADNKIKFKTPEMEIEFEDFEEEYKFIWYLNSKPASNKIEFDIESDGLEFYYQPPLTQEEIDRGDIRPPEVVGSYAIYHSIKGGRNDAYGKDYKSGKVGHIYRPRLIDSNGWEVWGDLHIENGLYTITIPEDFYNNAVYPIKSNDTFGYTTAGGGNSENYYEFNNSLETYRRKGTTHTLSTGGTLDNLVAYMAYNDFGSGLSDPQTVEVKLLINDEDSGGSGSHGEIAELTDSSYSMSETPAWITITASSESLSADELILNVMGNGSGVDTSGNKELSIRIYSDVTGSNNHYSEDSSTYPPTDPWVKSSGSGIKYSIYATYTPTPAGGPSPNPRIIIIQEF